MKKFVKLTLAAAALATAFVFASCSDSDDDSNTTTQTANGNGSGTTGTQGNGTVDTGNTGNSASSSSTSGTGNSGTENSGNSSGNSSSTGNTGSTAAEASGTVVEKSLTDLEGKIFKYTNEKGDRWYKFEGGKVYKSSDITNEYSWSDKTEEWNNKGISVVLFNGTQYASVEGGASSRTNGSGLYATFGGDDFPVAFRNDGTCTLPNENGGTISLNFTNENGLITLTMSGEKLYILYNGTSIYFVSDLLTEVTK